tara:strand:+ start:563 stop:1432 length:870 start_codon:yes stop_codon:yes gene_type:complete
MKGVLLAGGNGTRLFPLTKSVNKHLLPIYDKPMIFYSLSILMLADIREICIVCNENDLEAYKMLLADGHQLGLNLTYIIQVSPGGIPHGLLTAKDFVQDSSTMLVLGDNILHGTGLTEIISSSKFSGKGASIFTYIVNNPQDYGVLLCDENGKPIDLYEKPKDFISNNAIVGLYQFDNKVMEICEQIKPSARGEYEIIDVLRAYMEKGILENKSLSRGFAWLDTGNIDLINQAANFVESIQNRQGYLICSPEEIAYRKDWITKKEFKGLASSIPNCAYRDKLFEVLIQN